MTEHIFLFYDKNTQAITKLSRKQKENDMNNPQWKCVGIESNDIVKGLLDGKLVFGDYRVLNKNGTISIVERYTDEEDEYKLIYGIGSIRTHALDKNEGNDDVDIHIYDIPNALRIICFSDDLVHLEIYAVHLHDSTKLLQKIELEFDIPLASQLSSRIDISLEFDEPFYLISPQRDRISYFSKLFVL